MRKNFFEDMDNLDEIIEMCVARHEGKTTMTFNEMVEKFGLPIKPEALSRFCKYIGIYRDYLIRNKEEVNEQEILMEIQKEKRKMFDQRRELNRTVTELARMEGLMEMFEYHLENRVRIQAFEEERVLIKNPSNEREAVVFLSDIHYGIKVDNELNKFDTEICKESFRKLYEDTVNVLTMHDTNKVTLLLGGDLVSGIIHTNLRLQQLEDVIDQVFGVADLIEEMAINLRALGIEVKIVGTIGNHARVMADKKQNLNSENFERIIFKQLEKAGFPVLQESDVAIFKVAGNEVVALHGHQTSPQKAFNYCVKRKKVIPSTILMAHLHNDMRVDDGCVVIVNGSMVGTDAHALDMGYYSQPHQKIMIFEEGLGEICTFKSIFKR